MKNVKIADLKNNLSRHLSHVRDGGHITVFDRDRPVARIVPYTPGEPGRTRATARRDADATAERLVDLVRRGVVTRGDPEAVSDWLEQRRPVRLPAGAPSLLETLLQMRRESSR